MCRGMKKVEKQCFGGSLNGLRSSEYGHVGYHSIGNFKENNFGHLKFFCRGHIFRKKSKKRNLANVRAPQKMCRRGRGSNFSRYTSGDLIKHFPKEKPSLRLFSLFMCNLSYIAWAIQLVERVDNKVRTYRSGSFAFASFFQLSRRSFCCKIKKLRTFSERSSYTAQLQSKVNIRTR